MALRYADSFDLYNSAELPLRYTLAGSPHSINTTGGRNGSGCYQTGSGAMRISRTIDAQSTWITGFAVQRAGSPFVVTTLLGFSDSANIQCELRVSSVGLLEARRNGTLLATGSTPLLQDTWYHIAVKVVIADSGGRFIVKLNNGTEIDFTGDTKAQSAATANVVAIGALTASSPGLRFDDWWIMDGTGSVNNDMPADPDFRVAALRPTAAGNSTQWTPSAGSNWQNVDDALVDGDSTYNSSSTAGQKDTFTTANPPSPAASVVGVQLVTSARKDDAGSRVLRHVVRTGGTDYESGDLPLTDSYALQLTVRETNPDTASAWTDSDLDGLEVGYKLES